MAGVLRGELPVQCVRLRCLRCLGRNAADLQWLLRLGCSPCFFALRFFPRAGCRRGRARADRQRASRKIAQVGCHGARDAGRCRAVGWGAGDGRGQISPSSICVARTLTFTTSSEGANAEQI
jgi:hypothetical protein